MPKFMITGSEEVYYSKVVEATSVESLLEMIDSGEVTFDNNDIVDGVNYQVDAEIKEIE